jgi:hypothetical protein
MNMKQIFENKHPDENPNLPIDFKSLDSPRIVKSLKNREACL